MIIRRLILIAVLLAASAQAVPACAEEHQLTVTPLGWSINLPALLIKPEGDGPFPAIVLLHDCGGLGRSGGSPRRWANELVPQGYVVIIPDSFTPRGIRNGICNGGPGTQTASGYVRATDAYGALALLRTLPYVDGRRVGVMGGSHGGRTTLATLSLRTNRKSPVIAAQRDGFAAGLALYPRCNTSYDTWKVTRANGDHGPVTGYGGVYKAVAPLLILSGELDDWTPAEPCRLMVETARAAGQPLEIRIYPNAHHGFDGDSPVRFVAERGNPDSPTGKGATSGGNPEAWTDARLQVQAFFARHLKAQ